MASCLFSNGITIYQLKKSIVPCNNKPRLRMPFFQLTLLKKTKQSLHAETAEEGIPLFTLIQFTAAITATGRAKIEHDEAIGRLNTR